MYPLLTALGYWTQAYDGLCMNPKFDIIRDRDNLNTIQARSIGRKKGRKSLDINLLNV